MPYHVGVLTPPFSGTGEKGSLVGWIALLLARDPDSGGS